MAEWACGQDGTKRRTTFLNLRFSLFELVNMNSVLQMGIRY